MLITIQSTILLLCFLFLLDLSTEKKRGYIIIIYKDLYKLLGFDCNCFGVYYFDELLNNVVSWYMEGCSKAYIIEMLPCICLEYYHFDYDIPKSLYLKYINDFINSWKITDKNRRYNRKYKLLYRDFSYDNLLLHLGYMIYKENKNCDYKIYSKVKK